MDKVYEFLAAARDKCLHKKAALNLQTGAQGGFLARTEAVDEIYQQLDRLPFFKKCTLVDCDTAEAKCPIADMHISAADDETAFAAGVTVDWAGADGTTINETESTFKEGHLVCRSLIGYDWIVDYCRLLSSFAPRKLQSSFATSGLSRSERRQ